MTPTPLTRAASGPISDPGFESACRSYPRAGSRGKVGVLVGAAAIGAFLAGRAIDLDAARTIVCDGRVQRAARRLRGPLPAASGLARTAKRTAAGGCRRVRRAGRVRDLPAGAARAARHGRARRRRGRCGRRVLARPSVCGRGRQRRAAHVRSGTRPGSAAHSAVAPRAACARARCRLTGPRAAVMTRWWRSRARRASAPCSM
jgi:hypothetical protein